MWIVMTHTVYLALGTNLGDRPGNLKQATGALPPLVRLIAASPVYETPPWGYAEQPAFLNQVIQAETDLDPHALLAYLKRIEASMGRKTNFRNGPRVIDLDILFYDDTMLNSPELTIPHPSIPERAFVLVPLADLTPDFKHPSLGKTVRQMLDGIDTQGIHPFAG
jgi:2-amino-4-hydroxy-6-hydroxymethyldihydropteridine diphosphokinase